MWVQFDFITTIVRAAYKMGINRKVILSAWTIYDFAT